MKDDKVISIEVKGGVVVGVYGLPKGYTYGVVDYDVDECEFCNEGDCPNGRHGR